MKNNFLLCKREALLLLRKPVLFIQPILLFAIILCTFPLSLSNLHDLAQFAGPISWFAAMLAVLISLEGLWSEDERDGSLTQLILAPFSLTKIAYIKALVHWLVTGVPILLFMPLMMIFYQLPLAQLPMYWLTFALGTLSMSFLACLLAAIFVRVSQASLLLPGILLLLFIPITILVNALLAAAMQGMPTLGYAVLLLAISVFAFTIGPVSAALILKLTAD